MTLPESFSLTRLFISPNAVPANPTLTPDWIGGVMLTWDAISFANTVQVGPIIYQNLPVVNPNGLTEGTVLLANAPGGYMIMGMLGTTKSVTVIDPIRYRVLRSDISVTSSTTPVSAGLLNFLLNTNTQYAIDGCLFYNASTSSSIILAWDGPPNMACKWSNWGTQDTSFTHLLFDSMLAYGDASTQETYGWGHSAVMHPKGWFATSDSGGLLQLRFAQNTSSTTPSTLQAGSWLRISELGPASGTQTYVNIYPCTASQSYNGSGSPIASPDGVNNMYTWSLSGRSNGDEQHMWTFNAAQIRSDLAGATVFSAQMFLYCFAASSSPADYNWQWSTTATIAGTMPTNGFGGLDVKNLWVVGTWNGFDITSQISSILTGNANSVLGGSYNFTDSATGMHGYGYSTAYRPYVQISFAR